MPGNTKSNKQGGASLFDMLRTLMFVLYLTPLVVFAGPVKAPIYFKYGGGTAPEWAESDNPEKFPENGHYPVDWHYPVFQDHDQARLEKLNVWLRTTSLVGLTGEEAPQLKDSAILAKLNSDKEFREGAAIQAKLTPSVVHGSYILFVLYREWLGPARPQQSIEPIVFNYETGKPIDPQTLFKPEADGRLAFLLEKAIKQSFIDSKRQYAICAKQHPDVSKEVCPSQLNEDDFEYCTSQRSFNRGSVQIISNQEIYIGYPYNPAEWTACGYDGGYTIKDKSISRLMRSPEKFRQGVRPIELNASPSSIAPK